MAHRSRAAAAAAAVASLRLEAAATCGSAPCLAISARCVRALCIAEQHLRLRKGALSGAVDALASGSATLASARNLSAEAQGAVGAALVAARRCCGAKKVAAAERSLKDAAVVASRCGGRGDADDVPELPVDVLCRAIGMLPANDAARAACVCRVWRCAAARAALAERPPEPDGLYKCARCRASFWMVNGAPLAEERAGGRQRARSSLRRCSHHQPLRRVSPAECVEYVRRFVRAMLVALGEGESSSDEGSGESDVSLWPGDSDSSDGEGSSDGGDGGAEQRRRFWALVVENAGPAEGDGA